MKSIFMALALLASTSLYGNGLAEMGEIDRCESWVSNAMYGATQFMRGSPREVQYIPKSTLVEMLTNVGELGRDKLYILTRDGYSEGERRFLEMSTLFGYDAMSRWKSSNFGVVPRRDRWQQHFMAMCREHVAI